MTGVPGIRIRPLNDAPVRPRGRRVVYWMTAARRLRRNFGLQRAAERARELGRPLVVDSGIHSAPHQTVFALLKLSDDSVELRQHGA